MDVQPAHLNRDSFRDSFKGLVALEIIIDPPLGFFPISNIISHRQKISATTPRRVKQYHRRTYVSIYICMHVHIYIHVHICAQPAANVSQMYTLMSKEILYNAYDCTCTGAQNTCYKVHVTLTAKNAHICIHKHICIRIHIHTHTYPHANL